MKVTTHLQFMSKPPNTPAEWHNSTLPSNQAKLYTQSDLDQAVGERTKLLQCSLILADKREAIHLKNFQQLQQERDDLRRQLDEANARSAELPSKQ